MIDVIVDVFAGQVPCSGTCQLPMKYISKYRLYKRDQLEEFENNPDIELPTQQKLARKFQWFPLKNRKPVVGHIEGLDRVEYTQTEMELFDESFLERCKAEEEKVK